MYGGSGYGQVAWGGLLAGEGEAEPEPTGPGLALVISDTNVLTLTISDEAAEG